MARVNLTPSDIRRRSPTLAPFAPREPSNPEAQRFFLARVGYLGGATSGAQGRNTGERLAWCTTTQLHGTATTRTTTPSRFRCTCTSSGILLILFYEVEIFVS